MSSKHTLIHPGSRQKLSSFLVPLALMTVMSVMPALEAEGADVDIDTLSVQAAQALQTGNHRQARKLYSRLAHAAPDNPDFHVQLAKLHQREGRLQQAKQKAEAALALAPTHRDALETLAQVNSYLGEQKTARSLYRKLVKHHPDYAEGYLGLGAVLDQLKLTDQADKAREQYRQLTPAQAKKQ